MSRREFSMAAFLFFDRLPGEDVSEITQLTTMPNISVTCCLNVEGRFYNLTVQRHHALMFAR
jgi:hypothetical protein